MMRVLMEIAQGLEQFFRGQAGEYPNLNKQMHGLHVRVHPRWLQLWAEDWLGRYWPYPPSLRLPWLGGGAAWDYLRQIGRHPSRSELDNDRPSKWVELVRRAGSPGDHPVQVIVDLGGHADTTRFPSTWKEHPIVYVRKPLARAFAFRKRTDPVEGGVSIGQNMPAIDGTAGGLLRNGNGQDIYLMTCAHVAGPENTEVFHPAPVDSPDWILVGTVEHAIQPPQLQAGILCNRSSGAAAGNSDVAFIKVDDPRNVQLSVRSVGPLAGWRDIAALAQGDEVVFVGKESDRVEARIGDLSLWKKIIVDGIPRCFFDLFAIEHRVRPYLSQDLAKPGDSGSWVIHEADLELCGMLVGGERDRAYCCFAENLMDAFTSTIGSPTLV